jgi:LacI family transcriptional regulator
MSISVDKISQRAGVGRSTAYRVLGGDPRVSAEARAKVLRSIDELGLPRMRPKQRLRRRRRAIVLWLPGIAGSLAGPVTGEVLAATEAEVAARGRGVRIISQPLPGSPEELPLELLREDLDGILTIAFYSDKHLAAIARRWPVVSLMSSRQVPGVASVGPDYAGSARLAVEHLVAQGHRRIALVTGEVRERNFSRLFLDGYAGAMAQAGLAVDPSLVHSGPDNVGKGAAAQIDPPGQAAARALLSGGRRPTAIVARHDSLVGIVRAIAELGLRVPEDVSLVGCGGTGMPAGFRPQLTAACYSCPDMVKLALGLLGAVPPQGARILAPVELREGQSVRKLA